MRRRGLLLALTLVATAAFAAEDAADLLGRLRAPCCWKQTLDVHASPLADELREEIKRRVGAGESVAAIEADLVVRYTDRIRAVPNAGFLTPLGMFGMMAGVFGLIATIAVGIRLTRKKANDEPPLLAKNDGAPAPAAASAGDAADVATLRAELEALD